MIPLQAPGECELRVVQFLGNALDVALIGDFTSLDAVVKLVDDFNANEARAWYGYHVFDSSGECIRGPGNVYDWSNLGQTIASSIVRREPIARQAA